MIKFVLTLFISVGFSFSVLGQKPGWQNLDLSRDSVFGISTDKAYKELLKGRRSVPVIVAVIDSGIDTTHEDLQNVLWSEKNGAHGKSYMGYEQGKEDITKLATEKKQFYDSLSFAIVPETYRSAYKTYRTLSDDYQAHIRNLNLFLANLKHSKNVLEQIIRTIGKEDPGFEDFKNYKAKDDDEESIRKLIIERWPYYTGFRKLIFFELDNLIALCQYHLEHGLDPEEKGKERPNDSINNSIQTDALGLIENSNITPYHGTHVSGIIAAQRGNGKGMDGVADNVRIMTLKVVNNIREMRDRDLADAIRFATDNGAKVINMSLGKAYTINKKLVDEAVRYAMSKDVLIIHAAGNNGINIDTEKNIFYPTRKYLSGGEAKSWINVGASGPEDDSTLKADFSNYGKETIDVFAPGVQIYSTIPHSGYASWSGTSMAAPVVSGLAALIMEYYPKLTAVQVKDIIMKSVVKRDILKDKCFSGGVVNTYNALKLAATYK